MGVAGMIRVLSLGAGVQSSCVLLMSCRAVLPKLHAAVFADTQWEPKAVYRHLDWLEAEAARYGVPIYRVSRGNLRADALDFRARTHQGEKGGKRYASMPLFVKNPDGTQGIIRRQCTGEYKIEPVERFIRRKLLGLRPRQVAPAGAVEHWFGISADEVQRRRTSPNHWQTFRYPLLDDLTSPRRDGLFPRGFDRRDCLDWLRDQGYPEPPRSACIGCPFHTDEEWRRIRTESEEWQDAVAFDHEIRRRDAAGQRRKGLLVGLPYLHRSMLPLDRVPLDGPGGNEWGMQEECQGVCGV
jgi:hypothetical protein